MKRKKKIEKKTKPKLLARLQSTLDLVFVEIGKNYTDWLMILQTEDDRFDLVCLTQVINHTRRLLKKPPHRQKKNDINDCIDWLEHALILEQVEQKECIENLANALGESTKKTIKDLTEWKDSILGLD